MVLQNFYKFWACKLEFKSQTLSEKKFSHFPVNQKYFIAYHCIDSDMVAL